MMRSVLNSCFRFYLRQEKVLALIALFFLILFKPIIAYKLYTDLDDLCYSTWAAKFMFFDPGTCVRNAYPPGAGFLWMPASLATLLSNGFQLNTFLEVLPIWVGTLSYLYWALSGILFRSFLFLLTGPVLYYGTHRTTMVHAPEIFLAALLVHFCLKNKIWKSLIIALLLFSLRLNDFPALLLPLALFYRSFIAQKNKQNWLKLGWYTCVSLCALGFLYLAYRAKRGYYHTHFSGMIKHFTFHRMDRVFFGHDWGMIYTAPFWLFCLFFGMSYFRKISHLAKACVLWMLFELFVCICWRGNGSDFAYRYLIGSYGAAFVLLVEMKSESYSRWHAFIKPLQWFNALVLLWVTWVYKEFFSVTPQPTVRQLWTQPELLYNSLREFFRLKSYYRPFQHSSLSALYYTWTDSRSKYALEGGVESLAFVVLSVSVLLSLIILFIFGYRKFFNKKSAEDVESSSGLVVFILRARLQELDLIEKTLQIIESNGFHKVFYHELDHHQRINAQKNIRGGEWGRGPWAASGGAPCAVLVALDFKPKKPSRKELKKNPELDNANILKKAMIRKCINENLPQEEWFNGIHSSDSSKMAWEWIKILGFDQEQILKNTYR